MSEPADRLLSLNEVETLAAKAARGAGVDWGVADDLGRAARWLAERGLAWAGPLDALIGGGTMRDRLRAVFQAADRATGARLGEAWTAEPCDLIWAVPILSAAVHGRTLVLALRSDRFRVRLGPDGLASADVPFEILAAERLGRVAITIEADGPSLPYPIEPKYRRSLVADTDWHALQAAAFRTYVPSSARSRTAGAGGGRVDDE